MIRDIIFSARQTLGNIFLRGIGPREAVLIGAAAAQAVWLVFRVTALPLELRLTIAVAVSLVLLTIARVPIHGKRFEAFLLVWLRSVLRPKRYQHQTSARTLPRGADDLGLDDLQGIPDARPATAAASVAAPSRTLDWPSPDLGAVMACFVLLLAVASVLAWLTEARW